MKLIAFLLLSIVCFSTFGQEKNPFLSLKYDKVMMYDFEGGKGTDLYIVDDNGQLAKSISKQIDLDKFTAIKLSSKLGDRKSYGGGTAACFIPHLGFIYYLKNKIVGHVTICLACNRLYSSIEIPAQHQGKEVQGDHVYHNLDGLSNAFRLFLNSLLLKHDFSHQIKK